MVSMPWKVAVAATMMLVGVMESMPRRWRQCHAEHARGQLQVWLRTKTQSRARMLMEGEGVMLLLLLSGRQWWPRCHL